MFADAKVRFSQRVHSCSIVPLGRQAEPQFFPDNSAEKTTHRMSLPPGGVHYVFECRAARLIQQFQNLGRSDSSCTVRALLLSRYWFSPVGAFFRRFRDFPTCCGFGSGFGVGFYSGFASRHCDYLPFVLSLLLHRVSCCRLFIGRLADDLEARSVCFQFIVVAHSGFHSSLNPTVNASDK